MFYSFLKLKFNKEIITMAMFGYINQMSLAKFFWFYFSISLLSFSVDWEGILYNVASQTGGFCLSLT